jgi:pimeloyl-ACP methyl ester carboxylesterase
VDFVAAERSSFGWAGPDGAARIAAAGHRVHTLRGAGHWVHADNPTGLLALVAPSLDVRRHVASVHPMMKDLMAA